MRYVLLMCALLIWPVLASAQLVNGDFEQNNAWKFRRGWSRVCQSGNCMAQYQTDNSRFTPIARQAFTMRQDNVCDLSVWIKTDLDDEAFWSDGEPTRTGVTVQFWDLTGRRSHVAIDLARQPVHRRGYRGQAGDQGWTEYTGTIPMDAGDWEVRLYMHAVRTRVDGKVTKVHNARGLAWVDDISMRPSAN